MSADGPTLLLLDGTSVVRRVYEGVPGEDSPERAQGAITASLHSIKRSLKEHQPTHFLAAFDPAGSTWRHDLHPDYKVLRKPMYPGLRDQLPSLYGQMSDLGFRSICHPGVEADDTIGTIATKAAARGFVVVIVSNDVDMCSLLGPRIRVYSHFSKRWHDENWLFENWGVQPGQVSDAKALIGDQDKSIAGIAGVGPKIAARLLREHGDLEGVLSAAPKIKGVIGQRLVEGAEACRLGKKLFTLKRDVDLTIRPSELALPNRTWTPRPRLLEVAA